MITHPWWRPAGVTTTLASVAHILQYSFRAPCVHARGLQLQAHFACPRCTKNETCQGGAPRQVRGLAETGFQQGVSA